MSDLYMNSKMTVSDIMKKMIAYSDGNLHDINHFMKVWGYAKLESWDLVDLTHSSDSPWQKCYVSGGYRILIPDEIIKEYHKNEVLV